MGNNNSDNIQPLHEELNLPLVSVVICFYNEQLFLQEAVESVLKQDYKNLELLLVDDGSTDKSTEIALNFANCLPEKVFYRQHENHSNKGLSASRNHGIRESRGKFVAFLDADDVWLPSKLSNQVAIFQKNPEIGMILEGSEYWYSWNNAQSEDVKILVGTKPETVYDPPQLMFNLYPLGKGAAPVPSGFILKKETFEQYGYFEESFIKKFSLYEDQAFLAKIYLQQKIYVSSACNNLYRQRTGSIVESVKANGDYHAVRRHFLEWLQNYLKNKNIKNEKLARLLKTALLPYQHPTLYLVRNALKKEVVKLTKKIIPRRLKQTIKHNLYPAK